MAKNDEDRRSGSAGPTFGPGEGESAADAYPAPTDLRSRDAKDYVLVEKIVPEADGLRIEEQVLKADLEEGDAYKDLSLESDNVKESHPARNRPTSDLTDEEAEEAGRHKNESRGFDRPENPRGF